MTRPAGEALPVGQAGIDPVLTQGGPRGKPCSDAIRHTNSRTFGTVRYISAHGWYCGAETAARAFPRRSYGPGRRSVFVEDRQLVLRHEPAVLRRRGRVEGDEVGAKGHAAGPGNADPLA